MCIFNNGLVFIFLLHKFINTPNAQQICLGIYLIKSIALNILALMHPTHIRLRIGIHADIANEEHPKSFNLAPPNGPNGNTIHIHHVYPHHLHSKNFKKHPICNLDTWMLSLFYK